MHFFRVFLALSVAAVAWVASAIEETHFAFEGEDDADVVFQCNVPGRVRKSWSAYSKTEKKRYIDAVNLLSAQGHYSTLTGIHLYNSDWIHDTAYTVVWHRLFLYEFENALRATHADHACVTLPLWDWAADSSRARATNKEEQTDDRTPWTVSHSWLKDMGGPSVRTAGQMSTEEAARLPKYDNLNGFASVAAKGSPLASEMPGVVPHLANNQSAGTEFTTCAENDQPNWGPLPAPFEDFADETLSSAFPIAFVDENCSRRFRHVTLRVNGSLWRGVAAGYSETKDASVIGMTVPDLEEMIRRHPTYAVPKDDRSISHECATMGLTDNVTQATHGKCGFNIEFQMGTHAWVHGAVGGFMASNRSPADPIFWGHHGFVDYIWDMWSRYHTCNQDSGLQHLVGAVYDEVPPEHAGLCSGLFGCVTCGRGLYDNPTGSIGYFVGQNYSDGIDSPLPWTPLPALTRRALTKPPGVTRRTWEGKRTVRELLSLRHWGAYTYDRESLSLFKNSSVAAAGGTLLAAEVAAAAGGETRSARWTGLSGLQERVRPGGAASLLLVIAAALMVARHAQRRRASDSGGVFVAIP